MTRGVELGIKVRCSEISVNRLTSRPAIPLSFFSGARIAMNHSPFRVDDASSDFAQVTRLKAEEPEGA